MTDRPVSRRELPWDMTITCCAPAEWAADIFKRSTNIDSKENQVTAGRWHPSMVQPNGTMLPLTY